MMTFGLFLTLHVVVSLFLVAVILLQGGRGGLGEALGGSGGSSLFGGGGNIVMTRITAIGAGMFMVTCLLLAKLSTQRGRSVIERVPAMLPDLLPSQPSVIPDIPEPVAEAPAAAEAITEAVAAPSKSVPLVPSVPAAQSAEPATSSE